MLRNLEACNSRKPLPPPLELEGHGGNTVVLSEPTESWRKEMAIFAGTVGKERCR